MSKILPLLLLLLGTVVAPVAAQDVPPPDPLNARLPAWARVTASTRVRLDSDHLLERARLGVRLTPWRQVQLVAEVQDARAFGYDRTDGSVRDVLDVRQAWVGVGREQGWADLKVGRQKLAFGSERVIGGAEWGNTGRVFDAARLAVHHGGARVDLLAAAVVTNEPESPDHRQQGHTLLGAYGSITTLVPHATVEPYVLIRHLPTATGELGSRGSARSDTLGTRMIGALGAAWSYEGEVLVQRGHVASSDLRTWAGLAQVQRRFADARWSPSVLLEANYASGDHDRADGEVGTFDQLYPTNHAIYGVADRVGRRNTRNGRAGLALRPSSAFTLKVEGNAFWLADSHDALYAASGAVAVKAVPGGAISSFVGHELDVIADYRLSRHYDVGAQVGHLFPGAFLDTYDTAVHHTFYCAFVNVQL
ncbi:hypothetical protein TBR22_A40880 [Luteitalea sp. TBR-22]|uniref:alginate export family protein n=1 Tax=Luteitalea sp. TBR-22 TaxID=2802971 RepID=UPI001AF30666|nr:alginate export family protein [Luteitalea sp. TBR-22]BCS34862.1 hypothetical protein TBR22_A40880 [Luteitalea sp. TBR-22]